MVGWRRLGFGVDLGLGLWKVLVVRFIESGRCEEGNPKGGVGRIGGGS